MWRSSHHCLSKSIGIVVLERSPGQNCHPFSANTRRKSKKNQRSSLRLSPAIPPKSSQDKIEAYTPIENTPATQTIGETSISVISGAPTAIISKDPTKTAAKLLSQNQPESAILTINGVDPRTLSASQRAEILRIKASAYRQLNMTIAALRFDAERLRYIESETLVIVARKILKS